ncbi:MAG: hypothetical protein AAF570_01385 [Bacteroidota bacterium]
MKVDLYTKSVLTVIAACLVFLVVRNVSITPAAYADATELPRGHASIPVNDDGSINVVVKSFAPNEMMDVNIKDISTYDELKVNVTSVDTRDEVQVNIRGVETSDELAVNIDEVGGSSVSSGGPIRVKSE